MLVSTGTARLPASDIYVVVNMKLDPDFHVTDRNTLAILGRTVSTAIRFITRNAIDRLYAAAQRRGIGFHLSFIDAGFSAPARGPFDPDYMKALYQAGFDKGRGPQPFVGEPPESPYHAKKVAR